MNLALARKLAFRYILGLAVGASFVAVWGALQRAGFGWAWIVLVPALIALYLLGEWAFEPIFSSETSAAISESRFSALRVGFALALILPYFVVIIAMGWLAGGPPS
jgi:hypothetical protein